jgi:hypothetical protein
MSWLGTGWRVNRPHRAVSGVATSSWSTTSRLGDNVPFTAVPEPTFVVLPIPAGR